MKRPFKIHEKYTRIMDKVLYTRPATKSISYSLKLHKKLLDLFSFICKNTGMGTIQFKKSKIAHSFMICSLLLCRKTWVIKKSPRLDLPFLCHLGLSLTICFRGNSNDEPDYYQYLLIRAWFNFWQKYFERKIIRTIWSVKEIKK